MNLKKNRNYISNKTFDVRMFDVDPYRVVHHAAYMVWLEECWNSHIDEIIKTDSILSNSFSYNRYTVMNIECKYIRSIGLGNRANIFTNIRNVEEKVDGVLIEFFQWIINEKNKEKILTSSSKVYFYN